MFDAYEAVDTIIDEINEEYNESCYEDIYDELCERVECGLLSVADAELINEAAYEKYIIEASRMDKEALSLNKKMDEIQSRLSKETDPKMKDYLIDKYNELMLIGIRINKKGMDDVYRAYKLRVGRDDAKRIARGEPVTRNGQFLAATAKELEGNKFSPIANRKPGHYLRLQNSKR